jgi:hypothetical protein
MCANLEDYLVPARNSTYEPNDGLGFRRHDSPGSQSQVRDCRIIDLTVVDVCFATSRRLTGWGARDAASDYSAVYMFCDAESRS